MSELEKNVGGWALGIGIIAIVSLFISGSEREKKIHNLQMIINQILQDTPNQPMEYTYQTIPMQNRSIEDEFEWHDIERPLMLNSPQLQLNVEDEETDLEVIEPEIIDQPTENQQFTFEF